MQPGKANLHHSSTRYEEKAQYMVEMLGKKLVLYVAINIYYWYSDTFKNIPYLALEL